MLTYVKRAPQAQSERVVSPAKVEPPRRRPSAHRGLQYGFAGGIGAPRAMPVEPGSVAGRASPTIDVAALAQAQSNKSSLADPTEREADALAERLLHEPASAAKPQLQALPGSLSRSEAHSDSCTSDVQFRLAGESQKIQLGNGEPMPAAWREYFEPRIGHDLSNVRMHSDGRAALAAEKAGAKAFALGNHIVFGRNQLRLDQGEGRRLVAHELVHVAQQAQSGRTVISRQPLDPTAAPGAPSLNMGSPYNTLLPGYSQLGDTCGAASLVSALLIWDREHWDPHQPNSRVVDACNIILAKLLMQGRAAVKRWSEAPTPEVRRLCSGEDASCKRRNYEKSLENMTQQVENIRNAARIPGSTVTEADYQTLGMALYFMWGSGSSTGLSSGDIRGIQKTLGLEGQEKASDRVTSFDEIFTNPALTGLGVDESAQIAWLTQSKLPHALLVGRLATGEWFLLDQGMQPATRFQAQTLPGLAAKVRTAASSGAYWLFVGTHVEYMQKAGPIPSWTGVVPIGKSAHLRSQAENAIAPGVFLGEVDAGILTTGNRLTRGRFIAQEYSMGDAQSKLPSSSAGGLPGRVAAPRQ